MLESHLASVPGSGYGSGWLAGLWLPDAGLLLWGAGAELGTCGWPVMHILLTHVGMSQSPRGRGLTQRQAARHGQLGLCADGGDRFLLLTASSGEVPAPAAWRWEFGDNQVSHRIVRGSVVWVGFAEAAQSLPFFICLP